MPGRATLMGRARPPDATDDTRRLAETGTNNRQRFLGLNRMFREVRCKTVQPESDVHVIAGPQRWWCQANVRAATYSIRVGSGSLQTRDPRVDTSVTVGRKKLHAKRLVEGVLIRPPQRVCRLLRIPALDQ